MSETLEYEIDQVEGVGHARVILRPGINVLGGANGAGKTSTMRAIARAHGADVKLAKRDGAAKGRIQGPGGVRVTIGDKVFDGSVRAKLQALETALKQ